MNSYIAKAAGFLIAICIVWFGFNQPFLQSVFISLGALFGSILGEIAIKKLVGRKSTNRE